MKLVPRLCKTFCPVAVDRTAHTRYPKNGLNTPADVHTGEAGTNECEEGIPPESLYKINPGLRLRKS